MWGNQRLLTKICLVLTKKCHYVLMTDLITYGTLIESLSIFKTYLAINMFHDLDRLIRFMDFKSLVCSFVFPL